jgi:arylsulfatase A-like enzyme
MCLANGLARIVAQVSNLQGALADWKSAIQQVGNLRYAKHLPRFRGVLMRTIPPMQRFILSLVFASATLLASAAPAPTAPPTRPNIVFILADDLGYMDIGANNPKSFYETPHIDKLATQGMRFTDGYAACPVCSPTRASLMTGKYPARLHLTDFLGGTRAGKLLPAEYIDHLPLEEVTFAEALQEAGYTTCFVGKWHLGKEPYFPEAQGFQINIGGFSAGHPSSYFSPYHNPRLSDGPEGEYLTDRLTDEALKFIEANAKKPFLLYFSHYTVHIPLQAKTNVVAKYQAKAAARPRSTGPTYTLEGASEVRQVQENPKYAAMVESLDDSVGRVMDKLEALGIAKNTIVIFFSDNGGLSTAEGAPTSNVPLRCGKGWLYEGGIREPLLVKWPGVVKAASTCSTPVISTDFYPTLLAMAGVAPRPKQHCDGVSFVPLLKGDTTPQHETLFWHYPHYGNQGGQPGCAVRAGDWKLIRFFEDNHVELYNLKDDLSEKHDLATAQPAKVKELSALLDQFLKDTDAAMMKPNPNYDPSTPNHKKKGKKKTPAKLSLSTDD